MKKNDELLRNYDELVDVCLHNHFGGSRFDAVDEPVNYIKATVNAGYKTVAITDHGSFTSMVSCYDAVKKLDCNLKIIYGVEAYVETEFFNVSSKVAHIILMAVDEQGKHIIDKLNSNAELRRLGNPVISLKQLQEAKNEIHGHVIATSACISGSPALTLLINSIVDEKIKKEQAKLLKKKKNVEDYLNADDAMDYLSPDNASVISANEKAKKCKIELDNLIKQRDDKVNERKSEPMKTLAKQLRDAKKLKNTTEVERITKLFAKHDKDVADIKEKIKDAKKACTTANKEAKFYNEKVDGYNLIMQNINFLERSKKTETERIAETEKVLNFYASIFGKDNYFVEVQYHGLEDEAYVYPILAGLAKKNNLRIIAANDAHMADNTQRSIDMRNVAKFLRFTKVDESQADKELYIKSPNALAKWLKKILTDKQVDEAMMNLNILNERCSYTPSVTAHYPKYNKNADSNDLLRQICYKNIDWRYPDKAGWDDEHAERLEYELGIIIQMGFADYHLVVMDFLEYGRICGYVPTEKLSEVPLDIEGARKYAKKHGYNVGIGIGPGRGSGAGSLVTYLLGITEIDPLKYGLIFERFLNPERITMPDIDSDFAIGVREKTIEYVRNKYGNEAVVGIITENRQGVKGAIRDAARYIGKKDCDDDKRYLDLGNEMRKKVPAEPFTTFNSTYNEYEQNGEITEISVYDYLCSEYNENETALKILNVAKNIEGMLVSYGQHAAGVIIYDNDDITDYTPIRDGSNGIRVTECNMVQAEAMKLLKMDFLGLRNLNILSETARLVKRTKGITIDINNIPLEGSDADEVYYYIYAKGRTKNVFQMESPGMRKYLKELLHDGKGSIEDIISMNALYRPGPIDYIPDFINGRKNQQSIVYDCPELVPILRPTYGQIIFQEQVMQIFRDLAGYSWGRSDLIRRAMSKKHEDEIEAEREIFINGSEKLGINGCVKNGISKEAADKIYQKMYSFAKYAFNKSHATVYAIVSFKTAWMKYYYPVEYFASVLNYSDSIDKIQEVIADAVDFKIKIATPDINSSMQSFTIDNDKNEITFGLGKIKEVGTKAAEMIISERECNGFYKDIKDFIVRTPINSRVYESLVIAGAFDCMGYTRSQISYATPWIQEIFKQADGIRTKSNMISNACEVMNFCEEYEDVEEFKERIKAEGLSFSVTSKNVPTKNMISKRIETAKMVIANIYEEIKAIDIEYEASNVLKNLQGEKEVLGVYITGHPIDNYRVYTDSIADTEKGNNISLSGIISNLVIKRDKWGHLFASFNLEDFNGSINCAVFGSTYEDNADYLKESAAVMVKGKVSVDEFNSDKENVVLHMTVYEIHKLKKKGELYRFKTDNMSSWVESDYDMLKQYEDKDGMTLEVIDMETGLVRVANFTISNQAKIDGVVRVIS